MFSCPFPITNSILAMGVEHLLSRKSVSGRECGTEREDVSAVPDPDSSVPLQTDPWLQFQIWFSQAGSASVPRVNPLKNLFVLFTQLALIPFSHFHCLLSAGIRVLDGPLTDSMEAIAFNKHYQINDIYSCR